MNNNCRIVIDSGVAFSNPTKYVYENNLTKRLLCLDIKYVSDVKKGIKLYSIIRLYVYDSSLADQLEKNVKMGDPLKNVTGRLVAGATSNGNKLSYIVVENLQIDKKKECVSSTDSIKNKSLPATEKHDSVSGTDVKTTAADGSRPYGATTVKPTENTTNDQSKVSAKPDTSPADDPQSDLSKQTAVNADDKRVQPERNTVKEDDLQKLIDAEVNADWF
ncbi:hypothetical protein PO250_01330 [Limosilactobacillus mucosae]|uniref:Uncharacterized protein n=1 Tax=Limosilactobacillus mucosae TaxID=97478 RepID=A0AAJ1HS33_LIMMU|nr:hypothetical protein [Limosilactobacillus mucosae]MDC2828978.1 hypothetical protein [Limosilactobacillus mucosae]